MDAFSWLLVAFGYKWCQKEVMCTCKTRQVALIIPVSEGLMPHIECTKCVRSLLHCWVSFIQHQKTNGVIVQLGDGSSECCLPLKGFVLCLLDTNYFMNESQWCLGHFYFYNVEVQTLLHVSASCYKFKKCTVCGNMMILLCNNSWKHSTLMKSFGFFLRFCVW